MEESHFLLTLGVGRRERHGIVPHKHVPMYKNPKKGFKIA